MAMKSIFEHYGQQLKSKISLFLMYLSLSFRYFGLPHKEQTFRTQTDIKTGDIHISELTLATYMPENKDTWHRIAKSNKLDEVAFEYATWQFVGE
jgi:hypothetical protein